MGVEICDCDIGEGVVRKEGRVSSKAIEMVVNFDGVWISRTVKL